MQGIFANCHDHKSSAAKQPGLFKFSKYQGNRKNTLNSQEHWRLALFEELKGHDRARHKKMVSSNQLEEMHLTINYLKY